jgi:hypothetical protein
MNEKELALDFAQFFEPMVNSVRDNGAEWCTISVNRNGLVSATFYESKDGRYEKKLEVARNLDGEVRVIREEKLEVENGNK